MNEVVCNKAWGLTDMNIKGLYNGSIDEDINNIGVSQAIKRKN